jgi:hypothetical protein
MTIEPERRSRYGETLSGSIAHWPRSLNDLPVGLFQIIVDGREGFGLDGEMLIDFIRRCIYALVDAGAMPVRGAGIPGVAKWILQPQYGRSKQEIAEAVIAEWLRDGAPTPETWTGLWFGLPWSYAPEQQAS